MIKQIIHKLKKIVSGNTKGNALDDFIHKLKPEIIQFNTVLDVGAYHGNFVSQVLSINSQLAVHVFEPFQESFDIIQGKFSRRPNVHLNHAAVSDTTGKASLNINSFKETNSLLESSAVNAAIDSLTQMQSLESVDVICLDEYCIQKNITFIDLVKIDTQGNSFNVLKGLENMLLAKKVKYLYVEAEFVEIYRNEKLFSEIELLMRSYGYSIIELYNLNYIDTKKLGWCDVLFSPKN